MGVVGSSQSGGGRRMQPLFGRRDGNLASLRDAGFLARGPRVENPWLGIFPRGCEGEFGRKRWAGICRENFRGGTAGLRLLWFGVLGDGRILFPWRAGVGWLAFTHFVISPQGSAEEAQPDDSQQNESQKQYVHANGRKMTSLKLFSLSSP
jgi:hypothetical protein